jgi:hypothetical protein
MERHSVDEAAAFEILRSHSRATNRKLVGLAGAVVDGHPLLPKQSQAPSVGVPQEPWLRRERRQYTSVAAISLSRARPISVQAM